MRMALGGMRQFGQHLPRVVKADTTFTQIAGVRRDIADCFAGLPDE
jgi:hypothetical protein